MQQLALYLKEREGFDSIITDEGFACYRISGEECYIKDIWVAPDFRKSHIASKMADQITWIAKKSSCKFLTGSVAIGANNPETSIKVLLAYGFKLSGLVNGGIIFRKDI